MWLQRLFNDLVGSIVLFLTGTKEEDEFTQDINDLHAHVDDLPTREYIYRHKLIHWQEEKHYMQLQHRGVPPHPDETPTSPNYLGDLEEYPFYRMLNIQFYHTFPELCNEHRWLLKEKRYAQLDEQDALDAQTALLAEGLGKGVVHLYTVTMPKIYKKEVVDEKVKADA